MADAAENRGTVGSGHPTMRYPRLARAVEAAGHPLIVASALGLWWVLGKDDLAMLAALAATLFVAVTLEHLVPANPTWRLTPRAKVRLVCLYLLTFVLAGAATASYGNILPSAFADVRAWAAAVIRPADWPFPLLVLALYFFSDFVFYWIHRAVHRFPLLWRINGHGFHHAFQNMHTMNAGANHPLELLWVTLPLVLLTSITGAPDEAAAAAGVMLLSNSTLAHSNVRMRTPIYELFFTSSEHHRLHHSAVFEDSNTNYACNAILWDRLFGTFGRGEVRQTGIGPTEPTLWQMFLLPFRDPSDADTVTSRNRQ